MKDVDRRALGLSAVLATVAGFVDAIGFLDSGGLFVSFMSGNSTHAAVDLGAAGGAVALTSAALIGSFVLGVTAGGLVGVRARRAPPWIVAGSAVAVALSALLALTGGVELPRLALLAAAMGSLNTLFPAEGRARVPVTYTTGTLVTLGLAVSALLTGGSRTAWMRPLLLWSALIGGAVVGGVVHRIGSASALSLAALALAGAAAVLARRRTSSVRPPHRAG
ncbi:YoaK family protein [Microbacterium sp. LMI1-1-1.1]|uniref:YoaK family protein n=1 Tax=Microbacterium sp. LMI1-1-1.1 TaxID=3135223 RepID=UPI0034664B16